MLDDTPKRYDGGTPIPPHLILGVIAIAAVAALGLVALAAIYPPLYHLAMKAFSAGPRPGL